MYVKRVNSYKLLHGVFPLLCWRVFCRAHQRTELILLPSWDFWWMRSLADRANFVSNLNCSSFTLCWSCRSWRPFHSSVGKKTFSSAHTSQNRFICHRSFPADHKELCRGLRLKVHCLCSPPQRPHQHSCSWLTSPCQLLALEFLQKYQGRRKAVRRGRTGGKSYNGEWLHSPHSCPKSPSHWALSTKIPLGGEFLGSMQARGNELYF